MKKNRDSTSVIISRFLLAKTECICIISFTMFILSVFWPLSAHKRFLFIMANHCIFNSHKTVTTSHRFNGSKNDGEIFSTWRHLGGSAAATSFTGGGHAEKKKSKASHRRSNSVGGITKHEKYVLTKEISDDQTTGGKTSGGKQVMITVLSNMLNFMAKTAIYWQQWKERNLTSMITSVWHARTSSGGSHQSRAS